MNRRRMLQATGGIVGLGIIGTVPVTANETTDHPPGQTNDRGNWIRGQSELVDVVSVEEKTSDPSQDNFDEEFTFWKVTFAQQTFGTWVYREPDRLGGGNFVLDPEDDLDSDSFWYGVSAPDNKGVQHEIVHDGQAIQYFDTDEGWTELTAQFDDGELQHVNGETPE